MSDARPRNQRPVWPLLPGEYPPHRPCGQCARCVSGTRFPVTREGDCWDEYLTGATRPSGVGEQRRAGDVEDSGEAGDEVHADGVPAVLDSGDRFHVHVGKVGEFFLGETSSSSGVSDAVAD